MSDQTPIVPNQIPDQVQLQSLQNTIDSADKIVKNWAALEEVGATKGLDKQWLADVATVSRRLLDLMMNPPKVS